MYPIPLVLDTVSRYNIIGRDTLPSDWNRFVIPSHSAPPRRDENGNPITITHDVKVRIRLNDDFYSVQFCVVDMLSCPILLGNPTMEKRERVRIRHAHPFPLECHPGQTHLHLRLISVFYCPQQAADTQYQNAFLAQRVECAFSKRLTL